MPFLEDNIDLDKTIVEVEKCLTCISLSTWIQPATSGINMWLLDHHTIEMNIVMDKDFH